MQWSMKVKDRDENLNRLIEEGEQFDCKIWATIMESTFNLMKHVMGLPPALAGAAGALSNQYCYIGISKRKMYISIIETFKPEEETASLVIPFSEIKKAKIKWGVIPKRKVLVLYFCSNEKMKISVMSNAIGSDIKDQQENARKFFELISAINNS